MSFKKWRSSISGLFKKETESSSPSEESKIGVKNMAIRIVDAVLGYEKKFKKLQAEMLLEEQENKEKSVAEAAPEKIIPMIPVKTEEEQPPEEPPTCPICCVVYTKRRDPFVGSCGHTLCRSCVKSLRTYDCPICRKEGSFFEPAKNYFAHELLGRMKAIESDEEGEPDAGPVVPNAKGYNTDSDEEHSEADDDDDDENRLATTQDGELLRLRAEVVQLRRQRPIPMAQLRGRYDVIWHMIMTHSLNGVYPEAVRRLQRMIPTSTPYYNNLKADTGAMLRWGVGQRTGNVVLTQEEKDRWEDWPEEGENPGQNEEGEVTDEIRNRLILLHIFGWFFRLDYQERYLEGAGEEAKLRVLLFTTQFFNAEIDNMTVDVDYIPSWFRAN